MSPSASSSSSSSSSRRPRHHHHHHRSRHHRRPAPSNTSSSLYRDPRARPVPGLAPVQSILQVRPQEVRRIYFASGRRTLLDDAGILKWASQHHKAYIEVDDTELERISGTQHHEGVCILADPKHPSSMEAWLLSAASTSTSSLVVTGVANPYILGALIRTAVFFGTRHILHVRGGDLPGITAPAVYRASGGCSEHISHTEVGSPGEAVAAVRRLRVHYNVGPIIGLSELKGDEFTPNILNDPNYHSTTGASCLIVEGDRSKHSDGFQRQCKKWIRTFNKEGLSIGIAPALAAVLSSQNQSVK